MKNWKAYLVISFALIACDNVQVNTTTIDSAGEKLQHSVESAVDTVANKVGDWKDSLDKHYNSPDTVVIKEQ